MAHTRVSSSLARAGKRTGISRDAQTLSSTIDEARLLDAIRTLDGSGESSGAAQRLCEALGFFGELLQLLADAPDTPAAARAALETIWEARVLACLQRFVAKRKHVDPAFVGSCACSDSGCVQTLVRYTLATIAYYLAREPRLASAVVKTGLHSLVFDLLASGDDVASSDFSSNSVAHSTSSPSKQLERDAADPRDLLLAIDPFDWCYQSTCAQLTASRDDEDLTALFFVPLGLRSLAYLLAGDSLPADEISEHDAMLRRCKRNKSRCSSPAAPDANKRNRRLASIFTFATADAGGTLSPTERARAWQRRLCARRSEPAFRVLRAHAALQHLAIRCTAALLLTLPRASPERKALLHRDVRCAQVLQQLASTATALTRPHDNADHDSDATTALKRVGSTSIMRSQALPLQPHILARMAQSVLSLLDSDEGRSNTSTPPVFVASRELQPLGAAPDRAQSKKAVMIKCNGCKRPGAAPMSSLSLADRLAAASEETKRELAEHPLRSPLKRERALQQALRRQQVRAQCEYLEQLRRELSQSLHVLHSGRAHADPQQSFTAWIESLPTIESKERERRESESLRAQHVLEMQFQREEARKRRLRERALMLENDRNALDETEQTKREQKRLEFLRMHDEMERLKVQEQQHETHVVVVRFTDGDSDADEHVSGIEAKMLQQQTLSAQRKLRQSKLDDEQRRTQWVRERRNEARELECMGREDLYYVEKLLRLKQLEQDQRKLLAKQGGNNPLEEQQRKIERMRQLDLERRAAEKETERMRTEDLLARQCRYLEAEREQLQKQRERRERKQMETEERECRARWTLVANEQRRLDELEAKRLRVEARKLRKWQEAYEQQVLAAWVECWDEGGNVYYYNSVTGVSQWESPFSVVGQ